MNPDLVCATGFEVNVQQRRRREHLQGVVVGDTRFAVRGHRELPVVAAVAADRRIDGPRRRIEVPLDERVVTLVYGPLFERPLEQRVRPFGHRDHHDPRRADIETVDDPLTFVRSRGRDPETRSREGPDDRRAAPAQRGMRGDTHRLVDDDDVGVVVDDLEVLDRGRLDAQRLLRFGQRDVQHRARGEFVRLPHRHAVDDDVALLGQSGDDGARQPEHPGDTGIHAHPVEAVGHRQEPRFTHARRPRCRPGRAAHGGPPSPCGCRRSRNRARRGRPGGSRRTPRRSRRR